MPSPMHQKQPSTPPCAHSCVLCCLPRRCASKARQAPPPRPDPPRAQVHAVEEREGGLWVTLSPSGAGGEVESDRYAHNAAIGARQQPLAVRGRGDKLVCGAIGARHPCAGPAADSLSQSRVCAAQLTADAILPAARSIPAQAATGA